ncbi:DUF2975 domain-containing protein [Listeria costaricensis]|uniref:DUF2975 domain-containing protein n=1 Tax=Listeria costaricensis TaxID=2026604 RepID=UPI0013C4C26F|nr:DUF2975 domain-containing protein [Listeria costaricensis]
MNIQRLQKLSAFLNVCFKAISLIVAVTPIWLLWMMFFASDFSFNVDRSDALFSVSTSFKAVVDDGKSYQTEQNWTIFIAVTIALLLMAVALWLASLIFRDMKNGKTPFQKLTVKRLKRIGTLALSYAIIPQVFYAVVYSLLIPGFEITLSIGTAFILALLLFCMAEIFNYGVSLQQQSDETL